MGAIVPMPGASWNIPAADSGAHPAEPEADWDDTQAVPLLLLHEALSAIAGLPIDIEGILAEAGIESSRLGLDEGSVSAAEFGRFWLAVARSLDDELFCQDSMSMPRGSFTLLCHAVLHAPTLERAIMRMLRFYRISFSDFDPRFTVQDRVAEISILERGEPRSAFAYSIFFLLVMGVARWLIDRPIPLLSAEYRARSTQAAPHYRRMICDKLEFDRPRTLIRFDAHFLAVRPRRNEPQLKRFLLAAPGNMLTAYRSCDSLSSRIYQELRATRPEDWPSMDALAAKMKTTSSTLRRWLDQEESTFHSIKDTVRRDLAIRQLRQNRKTNVEIAEGLGFEDPSAFYRAFKKWTGATPSAYREPAML
jgi:AraC-like DNA-binding protein